MYSSKLEDVVSMLDAMHQYAGDLEKVVVDQTRETERFRGLYEDADDEREKAVCELASSRETNRDWVASLKSALDEERVAHGATSDRAVASEEAAGGRIRDLERKLGEERQRNAELDRQLMEARWRIEVERSTGAKVIGERDRLFDDKGKLESLLCEERRISADLEKQVDHLSTTVDEAGDVVQARDERIGQLEAELATSRLATDKLVETNAGLLADLESAGYQTELERKRREAAHDDIDTIHVNLVGAMAEVHRLREENGELKRRNADLLVALEGANDEYDVVYADYLELAAEVERLRGELLEAGEEAAAEAMARRDASNSANEWREAAIECRDEAWRSWSEIAVLRERVDRDGASLNHDGVVAADPR